MPIEKGDRIRIVNDKYGIINATIPWIGVYFLPPVGWEDIVESTPYWYTQVIKDEARFATLKNWFMGYNVKGVSIPSIRPESIVKI